MADFARFSRTLATLTISCLLASAARSQQPQLARERIAQENFGNDAPWFLANIPFFEIDDPEIQQTYYYRWKLYRAHMREIGPQGSNVLEFLPDVPWAREPYTDLNDSSSFHLLEGRWLRSSATVNALIDHLYAGGGNDRHFSESIADAAVQTTLVTGDPSPALRHLDSMQYVFNAWDDHFDRHRNLYWIEPLLDATEYTVASIDASGAGFTDTPSTDQNRNGFTQGFAYRPSINSYQYANALAIAHLLTLVGQPERAADYMARAQAIQSAVLAQLWNPALEHFTDVYQRSTPTVHAGDFIRSRELVGFTPWLYEMPPHAGERYAAAWSHLLNPSELAGPYGLRTVEASYPRYMVQYRYDQATSLRECQWNGPSWPFQTSQVLTAMANLLDDYPQTNVSPADYLRLLRQYTHQHFLTPGHPDLEEDYDPDTGGPIVGLPRSHHYNHSTYIDLILTGLVGIRPRADDVLELKPLLPTNAGNGTAVPRFFGLSGVRYHGHAIAIFYDRDGSRYHLGRGLTVFADGVRIAGPVPLGKLTVKLAPAKKMPSTTARIDLAANPGGVLNLPVATASSSESPDPAASAAKRDEAIDGRLWFFPEIVNGWSPNPTDAAPWYSVDLRKPQTLGSIELYFFADDPHWSAAGSYQLQMQTASGWVDVPGQTRSPREPLAGGLNRVFFPAISTKAIRVKFSKASDDRRFRLIELEAFAP